METIVSRLDLTQKLPAIPGERRSRSRMYLSEVMTIVRVLRTRCANAFHGSGYRTFKEFYTLHLLTSWQSPSSVDRQNSFTQACGD
ncbi:hypothetical protein [Chlorogloeopsis sp. ULAP02]|uniref:hypothetical protein n=1 Tax=Chlorogloeopsis sp. ULAP02 TaxID=3107926 RepID=UPI00313529E7